MPGIRAISICILSELPFLSPAFVTELRPPANERQRGHISALLEVSGSGKQEFIDNDCIYCEHFSKEVCWRIAEAKRK